MLKAVVLAARDTRVDPVFLAALVDQEGGLAGAGAAPPGDDAADGRARLGPLRLPYELAQWAGYAGPVEGLADPAANLEAGGRYVSYLLERYGGDTRSAAAAFLAGPRAVDLGGWRVAAEYVLDVEGRAARLAVEVAAVAVEEGLPEWPDFEPRPKFPLAVPYVSQLEPGPRGVQGYNNCGPACVTMALLYNGLATSTASYHDVAEQIRRAPWWEGDYTTLDEMLRATRASRIPMRFVSSWQEVFDSLDRRQPVLILLDNTPLEPRQYDRGRGWNAHHFVLLTGYTGVRDGVFYVNDPLRYYGWPPGGPGQYTVASVRAGVANVGGVQALAIDQLPPPGPGDDDETETRGETLMPVTDEELKRYLSQLGQPINMETAIIRRACLAYRRGETRGPAISDEYSATTADGRRVIRQNFTAGIGEYDPRSGDVVWVEAVAHPETIRPPG
jgi:hypothetical protein